MSTADTNPSSADLHLEDGDRAAKATLKTLMRYRGLTNRELGGRVGMQPNRVQHYTGGTGKLTAGLMWLFAPALGVEPYVLAMGEDEALTWVLAHAPNGSFRSVDIDGFLRAITHEETSTQRTIWDAIDEAAIAVVDIRDNTPIGGSVSGPGTADLQGSRAA